MQQNDKLAMNMLIDSGACVLMVFWFAKNFPDGGTFGDVISKLDRQRNTGGYIEWLIIKFKLTGRGKNWDAYGNLISDVCYVNGVRHGYCRCFQDGRMIFECNYKNDVIDGICREWDTAGLPVADRTFRDGVIVEDKV